MPIHCREPLTVSQANEPETQAAVERSVLSALEPAERDRLLGAAAVRQWPEGALICRHQHANDQVFILVRGRAQAEMDLRGRTIALGELHPGEIIGEVSALFEVPCSASVRALEPVVALELPGRMVREWAARRLRFHEAILELYRQRVLCRALRSVALFDVVEESELRRVADEAAVLSLAADTAIVREGELGDAFYVILAGEMEVCHPPPGEGAVIATLGPGDYFGEWSLLTGAPRSGSVYARSRVDLVSIERGPFLGFIQRNPRIREGIDLVAHRRHDSHGAPGGP